MSYLPFKKQPGKRSVSNKIDFPPPPPLMFSLVAAQGCASSDDTTQIQPLLALHPPGWLGSSRVCSGGAGRAGVFLLGCSSGQVEVGQTSEQST